MLSAAFDILSKVDKSTSHTVGSNSSVDYCQLQYDYCEGVRQNNTGHYPHRECNKVSTGVILLADILPTLIIKATAPWFMAAIPYWIRISSCVLASMGSFVIVAFANTTGILILGVCCASYGSGLGELSFLSLTSYYDKSTISAWSSGTGAAGVAGALVYAALLEFTTPKVALLLQLVVPVLLAVSYFFILTKRTTTQPGRSRVPSPEQLSILASDSVNVTSSLGDTQSRWRVKYTTARALLIKRIKLLPFLSQFMLPLFGVYSAEYLINQGLYEQLYYENTHIGGLCLNQHSQYRWYQVMYQVGVVISRSSTFLVHIKHFWVLTILQIMTFLLLFYEAIYTFIPSFWITFFIILWEGLLGGATYVNAFYQLSSSVSDEHREFAMGATSVADTTGITLAGISSIFLHNYICEHVIDNISPTCPS
ncbi:battenin-like isoform X2 [Dysidea avara]